MAFLRKYFLIIIVALIGFVFIWQSNSGKEVQSASIDLPSNTPDVFMTEMDLIRYSETGEPVQKVLAKTVATYNDTGKSILTLPIVTLLRDQQSNWKITAKEAIVYDNEDIEFFSDVIVTKLNSEPVSVVKSDYMKVTEQGNLVITEEPVEITQGKQIINAVGMKVNLGTISPIIYLKDQVTFSYDPT